MAKTCHAQPFVPTEGAVPTEAAGSAAKARNEGIGGLRLTRRQGHKVRQILTRPLVSWRRSPSVHQMPCRCSPHPSENMRPWAGL